MQTSDFLTNLFHLKKYQIINEQDSKYPKDMYPKMDNSRRSSQTKRGNKVKKIQYLSTIDEEKFAELSKIADIDDYSTHK